MWKKNNDPKVIVALDFDNSDEVFELLKKIDPSDCRLKVGKELFTACGPELVKALVMLKYDVFLDLKFHDIPNTVAKAVATAAKMGVWMVNVHAMGGLEMMEQAKEALIPYGEKAPLLIAVTVLTSMGEEDLNQVGINRNPSTQVVDLAKLVLQAKLDGVVCSAQENITLKNIFSDTLKLITPGIRPIGTNVNDQKRIATPEQAIENGSDYLVIGRPITQADDPKKVLKEINASIS